MSYCFPLGIECNRFVNLVPVVKWHYNYANVHCKIRRCRDLRNVPMSAPKRKLPFMLAQHGRQPCVLRCANATEVRAPLTSATCRELQVPDCSRWWMRGSSWSEQSYLTKCCCRANIPLPWRTYAHTQLKSIYTKATPTFFLTVIHLVTFLMFFILVIIPPMHVCAYVCIWIADQQKA